MDGQMTGKITRRQKNEGNVMENKETQMTEINEQSMKGGIKKKTEVYRQMKELTNRDILIITRFSEPDGSSLLDLRRAGDEMIDTYF